MSDGKSLATRDTRPSNPTLLKFQELRNYLELLMRVRDTLIVGNNNSPSYPGAPAPAQSKHMPLDLVKQIEKDISELLRTLTVVRDDIAALSEL